MIASLPMYDHPALRADWDALWRHIGRSLRQLGIDAPQELERGRDLRAQWLDPDLLLGQTCGLPYRAGLHEDVTLLGAFDFALPDTPSGHYHSVFVARKDDPRDWPVEYDGATLAFNEPLSHSGWFAATRAPVRFKLGPETGSHAASAVSVVDGLADIAALDAVTWSILSKHEPAAHRLKVVARSGNAPGLPLITAKPDLAGALIGAISEGIASQARPLQRHLGLNGFVAMAETDYLSVPIPQTPAQYRGAER